MLHNRHTPFLIGGSVLLCALLLAGWLTLAPRPQPPAALGCGPDEQCQEIVATPQHSRAEVPPPRAPTATRSPLPGPQRGTAVIPASAPTAVAEAPANTSLPTPGELVVHPDDQNAILEWNGGAQRPDQPLPEGVVGYQITWGPQSQPDAHRALTSEQIIQLQPLARDETYTAHVQAVDYLGRLSAPSQPVEFTSDTQRVDALRASMNGFFDDFDLPEGAPDELKWNSAYSGCNNPELNGFFINNQVHVHNMVASGACDRAQNVSRPRATLDFSDDGTRTIVFDFDGEFRRNQWYLDIVPRPMDISGQVHIEAEGDQRADPANGLRFHQNEQNVAIYAFTPSGSEQALATTDGDPYPALDWAGLKLVSNVRRHWEIRLSRTSAEIRIDGRLVLATAPGALNLTEDRYTVLWNAFSYNTDKANEPAVLAHWDNFGFDAPAGTRPTSVTHNYRITESAAASQAVDGSQAHPIALHIPDQISGATARRLMFTLQMDGYDTYSWDPDDAVIVNGSRFSIPQPATNTEPPIALENLVSSIAPYSTQIELPDGALRQGENTIVFSARGSQFRNIHVEIDFPIDAAPQYTPPAELERHNQDHGHPMIAIGPNAVISRIGAAEVESYVEGLDQPETFNPAVSGVVDVEVVVQNEIAMHGSGVNLGIAQVELLVDGQVYAIERTDTQAPAPSVRYTFSLDTRLLADGQHELSVRAYNPRCDASIADYQGAGPGAGQYFPLHITTDNGVAAAAAPQQPPVDILCQAPGTPALAAGQP